MSGQSSQQQQQSMHNSIQDGESVVTLDSFTPFPKLPTELRWKIWKHTLPGPRVLRYPHYKTATICKLTNRALKLNFANREARQIFDSFYKKLEVPHMPASVSAKEKVFLFVDYEIDTVFINTSWGGCWGGPEKRPEDDGLPQFLNSLSLVKHLAIPSEFHYWFDIWEETEEEEEEWRAITTHCKSLQSLTYVSVDVEDPICGKWGDEWFLVDVEGQAKKFLSLSTSNRIFAEGEGLDRETPHLEGLDEVGILNMMCIGASHIRGRLEALERTRIKQLTDTNGQNKKEKTSHLQFKFNTVATRSGPKKPWMLEYSYMIDHRNGGRNNHQHVSPILLGDGTLGSCTLVEQVPGSNPACRCKVERWQWAWEGIGTGDAGGEDFSDDDDDEEDDDEDDYDDAGYDEGDDDEYPKYYM